MWALKDLVVHMDSTRIAINGKWVPARPHAGYGWFAFRPRLRAAWAVFRGRADAFVWPEGQ